MDERTVAHWRGHLARLAALLVLAVGVRAWVLTHTEVAARDSIGFIRYALHLETPCAWPFPGKSVTDPRPQTPLDVIRTAEQPPVYPLAVLAVSKSVRHFRGTTPDSMVLSAQLVSALAGVLLVVPMYFLGYALFHRWAGFAAAALFQCLPGCTAITTDALSEATFLLIASATLLMAVWAVRRPTPGRLALVGLGSALAYLTRPEGLGLAVATAAVLLGRWLITRREGRAALPGLAGLAVGLLALAGPYVVLIGGLSNKPTPQKVIRGEEEAPVGTKKPAAAVGDKHLLASVWAAWMTAEQGSHSRLVWSARTLAQETLQCSLYVVGVLALIGIWRLRRDLAHDAGLWVPLVLAGLHAALLLRMGVVIGYLSERHTLLLVLVGCYWAAAVLPVLAADWLPRFRPFAVAGGVLALIVVAGGVGLRKTLHQNRAGHHAAGLWLAQHAGPDDAIVDPFCWAHYYSGAVFREGRVPPPRPVGTPETCFIIWEQSSNQHSRLPLLDTARNLKRMGRPVWWWPVDRPRDQAAVVVYQLQIKQ